MATPPRDEDGIVVPHDDRETIPDTSCVVRYIHRKQLSKAADGILHPSSGAFSATSKSRDRYEGMSVVMLDRLRDANLHPSSRMPPDHVGAVLIEAGKLRQLGLQVGPDPMVNDDPFHASVWGVKSSHRKKIKKLSVWLIEPSIS